MTAAQTRLMDAIRNAGECAEYWPVVNNWVKDSGPAKSLALRNINRTVDSLVRARLITIDDDGIFRLTETAVSRGW